METCGHQEKDASSPQVLLEIFLQIQNLFWRYAELNRLRVGWTKFPFYELCQQNWGQGCIGYKFEGWSRESRVKLKAVMKNICVLNKALIDKIIV